MASCSIAQLPGIPAACIGLKCEEYPNSSLLTVCACSAGEARRWPDGSGTANSSAESAADPGLPAGRLRPAQPGVRLRGGPALSPVSAGRGERERREERGVAAEHITLHTPYIGGGAGLGRGGSRHRSRADTEPGCRPEQKLPGDGGADPLG